MPVFEIRATPRKAGAHFASLFDDRMQCLFGALLHNGQVYPDEVTYTRAGERRWVVRTPRSDSLRRAFHSVEVRDEVARLRTFSSRPLRVRRLDDERDERLPRLERIGLLVLSTGVFDRESPIRGGRGERYPVYLLPVEQDIRRRVHAWAVAYREYDSIWLSSGRLALSAYRQLADPRSELSREGRALCAAIEASARVPTYYDLYRYHGREQGEERRRCPVCSGAWRGRLSFPWMEFFDFRCRKCRLLSNRAYSTKTADDARWAHIGEPRK